MLNPIEIEGEIESETPRGKMAYPTPASRKAAFRRLFDWIAAGHSVDSWEELERTQIYKYLKRYPEDWPIEEFKKARRIAMGKWEKFRDAALLGQIKGAHPALIMRRMEMAWPEAYGYKALQNQSTESTGVTVEIVKFNQLPSPNEDQAS